MPEIVKLTAYRLDELSHPAQEKARQWYRHTCLDYDWWDFTFEDFDQICETLGISLRAQSNKGDGPARKSIFFSGFSSQGDGACFEGSYAYKKGAHRLIRHNAPQDAELHRIADVLKDIQRKNFYRIGATIEHHGRYYHEHCMAIAIDTDCSQSSQCASETKQIVNEALRDLARWLYRRLESEYDYLSSDDLVDEDVRANGFVFTAAGRLLVIN